MAKKIEYAPYKHQEFPKFKYHETKEPVIVADKNEEGYLNDVFPGEWKDSPADFGIVTHPGLEDNQKEKYGFSFADLKKEVEAKKAEAAAKTAGVTKKG